MSPGPFIASLSDADLRRFLARVDREILRLGTREHLSSVRVLDEAKAQGASLQAFGDSLVSALATDRDTWQALRRLFDEEFAPQAVPVPNRWPRTLAITHAWGGHVDITANRAPHFGRLGDNLWYAQGFSGHGMALANLAGAVLAEAIAGQCERFDVYARIPHRTFPGGERLRVPLLMLAMLGFRLRDWL